MTRDTLQVLALRKTVSDLKDQNALLNAERAKDKALLRQALEGIELHLRHHERGCVFLDEIALALRERLGMAS